MKQHHIPAEVEAQIARTEGYVRQDPQNASLLARLIDLCLEAGDADRANRYADMAIALAPADPYTRYRKAHALLASREFAAAAAEFGTLQAQQDDPAIAHSLARCRMAMGDYAGAVTAMGSHAAAESLPASVATLLVRCLHHAGQLEEAVGLAARHEARLADAPEFLAAGALANLDLGNIDEAARLSKLAGASEHAPVEAMVVDATLSLERAPQEAAEIFRRVLERQPQEGRSWSGLGMASLMQQDFQNGAQQLETALKYMPQHIGTMHLLGWCRLFTDDLAGAEALFQRAYEVDRNFAETHGGLAVVAARRGDAVQAEAWAERALRLDPESLSARYARIVLSGEAADPERFKAIAFQLLSRQRTPSGGNLADAVLRHTGN